MRIYESDLDKTIERDSIKDVEKVQDNIQDKYQWANLGEQGVRINNILEDVEPKNEMLCLEKWMAHLEKELVFPISAIVSESEDSWRIQDGDKVNIKALYDIVDMYGIIATISFEGNKFEFPLCDLEAIDQSKSDYQLIHDYSVWFSNS